MSKPEAGRLAQRAHDGIARAVLPAHTTYDGDTAYALASGRQSASFDLVAALAVECVGESIRNAVRNAEPTAEILGLGAATGVAYEAGRSAGAALPRHRGAATGS